MISRKDSLPGIDICLPREAMRGNTILRDGFSISATPL